MGGGQLDHGVFIGKGENASQILCNSAIEIVHVHDGPFLLFLSYLCFFKAFEVGSSISISWSCFSLLSALSTSTDSRDFNWAFLM